METMLNKNYNSFGDDQQKRTEVLANDVIYGI